MESRATRSAVTLIAAATVITTTLGGVGVSVAQTPMTLRIPHTVWEQGGSDGVDGLGSWIGIAEDPVASAGQAAPSYFFAQTFFFENKAPGGIIGLTTSNGAKHVVFGVIDANNNTQAFSKAYNWIPGNFYLPMVVATGDGRATGFVYDLTNNVWTPIITLGIPQAWGKLGRTSVTWTSWTGPVQDSCAKYPRVDVFRYPSAGFTGLGTDNIGLSIATPATHATLAGNCQTSETVGPAPWVHSQLGA